MVKKSCKCKCPKSSYKRDRENEMQKLYAEAKINAEFSDNEKIGLQDMSPQKEERYKILREIQRTGKGNF
jgi:hypothetical protein